MFPHGYGKPGKKLEGGVDNTGKPENCAGNWLQGPLPRTRAEVGEAQKINAA